jgi:hypothetical protein
MSDAQKQTCSLWLSKVPNRTRRPHAGNIY